MKNNFIFFYFVLFFASCTYNSSLRKQQHMKLWYNSPADASVFDSPEGWKDDKEWLRALPLGNGSLGAMVYGDVHMERIQLSEESMWSGSPEDNDNPDAFPAIAKIREYLFTDKYKEASLLTERTQICKGKGSGHGNGAEVPFGCFQTLGDLWLDFVNKSKYKNYHRHLDLHEAIAKVSYTQEDIQYKREVFVSEPDQVMVIHLTADNPGSLSFAGRLTRPEKYETYTENNQLVMKGSLSDGKGGKGLNYMTRLTVVNENGTVRYNDSSFIVEDADEVMILLSASTDYVLDYPTYKGREYKQITNDNLVYAKETSYEKLRYRHLQEYTPYFDRVSFSLTEGPDTIPTDRRLKNYGKNGGDHYLVEKMFQYGRYLLIASSRPGSLPANLQGVWANKIQTPWNGDYHTDVNIQMNYWPAEVTNLREMHLPLFDLMESLQKPGARTADIHYKAAGWVVHPITNIWGYTSPGEHYSWGMHVGAGAWLATHIMEHYYFTLDKTFLEKMYPVLSGSTRFYLEWLIPDPVTGKLLSGPSVSPENTFIAPDGTKTQICMGPSHDQQVIWQLFTNYLDASDALDKKEELYQEVMEAREKLALPIKAMDGRLMEWNDEFEEVEPGHRHISHLFGLHPGYQIDIKETPDLAEAARKSLDYRINNGGGHTGWSAAWLINQYARLGDGKKALASLHTVLMKSTNPNLFSSHPPFQMDANFGTVSGIAEMLIQSQTGEIRLLPALPSEWKNGEVKGLCARGGFVVNMQWKESSLTSVKIHSQKGGKCSISYKGKIYKLETEAGNTYEPEIR